MWEGYTTAHRTRVRALADARLEAGWVQCMRHARARLGKNDDATAFALGWYRPSVGVPGTYR
jgi:hypothetical protein